MEKSILVPMILIRQLTFDNKSLPYMRRISLSSLQQKIEEINLLMTLHTQNKSLKVFKIS